MKIILAILAVGVIGFLFLGFLFVQWANSPENVARFQKEREEQAARKAEEDQKQTKLNEEINAKRVNLKLVIDENFANNRFEFLDYKFDKSSQFKFEKKQFSYNVFSTRNSNPVNYFIFSKEDFEDFAAEMNFTIHGYDARAGIFWNTQPNSDRDPTEYQVAYSSASGLDVQAGESEGYNLGSFFESVTTQKLRVERFGKRLKVSINDEVFFDKDVKNAEPGKVGIFLRNRGGNKKDTNPISIDINSFKVWK